MTGILQGCSVVAKDVVFVVKGSLATKPPGLKIETCEGTELKA
jgi:hypothetical protein